MKKELTLAELRPTEKAIILNFKNQEVELKMMEMGVNINAPIELAYLAPMGGPIAIRLASGSLISLRKATATNIVIKKIIL